MEGTPIKEIRVDYNDYYKKVMYMAREMLIWTERLNIISGLFWKKFWRTWNNSSGIASKAAETLARVGYVTYENIRTETIIENNKRKTQFIITIKKTKDFLKLYKENEEKKKKMEAEKKANATSK